MTLLFKHLLENHKTSIVETRCSNLSKYLKIAAEIAVKYLLSKNLVYLCLQISENVEKHNTI